MGEIFTKIRIQLTDSEWISLIDGEDEGLERCCANISALRDSLIRIVRDGRDRELMTFDLDDLKQKIKWVADGHELPPLIQKICEQIGFDPKEATHERGIH